jgi:phage tail tape-measure protein
MGTNRRSEEVVHVEEDLNRDPITGTPGAHPIGTGLGAGALGAAAAGAAAGLGAGPVGAAVGAVVGAVVGGLAGKGIAEQIDPTVEYAYWEKTYPSTGYYDAKVEYKDIAPAYRYGWESRARHEGKRWEDVESDLEAGWNETKHDARVGWHQAKSAARDAWERVELSGDRHKATKS